MQAEGYRSGSLGVNAKSGSIIDAGTLKLKWWGKKAVPELIQQLHSKNSYTREGTCRLLGSLKAVAAPAVPDLIELVKNDPHITVRFEAAAALGQIGPSAKPAVPDLIRALQNDKHGVPREAAKALGLIGEPSAVGALKAALGHQEIAVRRAALESLKGEPFRGLAPAIAPLLEIGQSHVVIVHHELMILALRALREDGAGRVAILIETPVSEQLRGEWPFLVKLLTGQRLKTPEQLLTWWWRFPMPPPAIKTAHLDAKQLKALWDELGDEESLKAYRATQTMASGGDQTLAFLAERFKPVSANPKRIKAMITELDDDEYAVRNKAFEELSRIGRPAEAALRAALKGELSAEARPRVSELLEACSRPYPVLPEARRVARAVRVLELIGTPAAVRTLGKLAHGTPKAPTTERAKVALQRLGGARATLPAIPGDASPQATQAVRSRVKSDVDPAAWAILERLEKAGEKYATLRADLDYQVDSRMTGDKELRTGEVAYQKKTKAQPAKYRVLFKTLRLDEGPRTKRKIDYIFDGRFVIRDDYKIKTRTKWEVSPEDAKNALKIGKGPFPVPFGQKASDMVQYLRATTRQPIKKDPPNTDYLKLVPRKGHGKDVNFVLLEMWVDRKTNLPIKIKSRDNSKNITTVVFKNIQTQSKIDPKIFNKKKPPGFELIVERLK